MSSDDDNAFRGGLGSGGGRRRRSDASLFGVFADSSDGEGGGGRRRGKGRGRRDKRQPTSPSKPLAFVRGAVINKTAVPAKRPSNEDGEKSDDDEIDPRFRFDGAGPAGQELPPVEHGPKMPARNQMSFGQMASNYGKGFAMLQKMGFQGGGLGKREDGIANPIEVIKRKERQGLQDDGEMAEQDLYGTEHLGNRRSVEELLSRKPSHEDGPKPGEGWKKGDRAKRPKVLYKTAAEVAAAAAAGEPGLRIVDMRGPEVRVASSFSELAMSISGDSVKSLKELRHNTRLLVAKYEDKIRSLAEKKKFYQDVLLSVQREKAQLEAAAGLGQDEMRHCREMVSEIEALRERQDQGTVSLSELGAAFGRMRESRPKEFKAIKALEVAVALALPVAKQELACWQPLEQPQSGVKPLRPWRKLEEGQDVGVAVVSVLCDGALLPRLRHALMSWSPRDYEPCIRLVESCREELPPKVAESVVRDVVLQRLQAEVESWDPRVDAAPIHVWIHPWLPLLNGQLCPLWAPIRFKLSNCLERWDPKDHSVLGVLRPWRTVFDVANWEPLIEKVLGRLERALADTPVRPDGQDVGPIRDLVAWLDIAPLSGLAQVLQAAFFPQWHAALREWLRAPGCDYREVLHWYQGWRTLLPEALREEGSVQKQLAHGLQVMKHFMSGGAREDVSDAEAEPADPPPPAQGDAAQRDADPKAGAATSVEEVSLSLSDYLADVAGEQGLIFRPKGRTNHAGQQVYQLGAASITLEKNMVLLAPKDGGDDWRPVSFDELLRVAQKEVPKRRP
mmetsp:Transcript_60143/g.167812  ORF Transcript_60143/g.167812 Transcript_60143/m.167812 type:complete len:789 (+) Transcript_60143:114-2480(+)